jgi:Domain of unknown function (DUF5134)
MTPAWLLDIVAALMLVVAAVSAARLLVTRPWRHGAAVIGTDVAHLLMAIAMAGMLTASLATLPAAAWEVIFGLLTVWFAVRVLVDARANGVRALAGGHCAPHLVHSAAMLYMFLALTAPAAGAGAMSAMGATAGGSVSMMALRVPTLGFLFALILVGYSAWDLDQLSGRRYSEGTASVSLAGVGADAVGVLALAGIQPRTAGLPASEDEGTPADRNPEQAAAADWAAAASGGYGARGFLLSPAVTVGARITVGAAMVFMLIIAI